MAIVNNSSPDDEDFLARATSGDDNNYKAMLLNQLRMQNQTPPPDSGNNALVAGLNQSFAKLGTIGGKTADTSDVSRYANTLDQMKAVKQQQDTAKTGQQEKILGLLAQLKDKDSQKQDAMAFNQQKLDQAKDQRLADQQFQQSQQDRLFGQQKTLQGMKQEGAQTLAQTKAETKPSVFDTARDKAAAKTYGDFVDNGGYGVIQRGVQELNNAANALGSDTSLTGPIAGHTPDFVRAFTNPKAIDIKAQVEDVVQRSLKEIFGARPTQAEWQSVMQKAYDPTLDTKTNQERVLRLAGALNRAAEAKMNAAKYLEENGTLKGFKGTVANSVDDLVSDLDKSPAASIAKAQPQNPAAGNDIKAMGVGTPEAPVTNPVAPKVNSQKFESQAPGSKKIIGGTTYTKGPDGLWHEE